MKHFHVGGVTGTLTTGGIVFGWRNASTTVKQYIQKVRMSVTPVALPTAAGVLELRMSLNGALTADYATGTDLSPFISARILDLQRILTASQIPASAAIPSNIIIAATGTLTAGAGTPATQPWMHGGIFLPATATGAPVAVAPPLVVEWVNPTLGLEHEDPFQGCLALATDTGFVGQVTLPAGCTAQLSVNVDWLE